MIVAISGLMDRFPKMRHDPDKPKPVYRGRRPPRGVGGHGEVEVAANRLFPFCGGRGLTITVSDPRAQAPASNVQLLALVSVGSSPE